MQAVTKTTSTELSTVSRVKELTSKATADNTKRAYLADWNQFTSWCMDTGTDSLPALPGTLAAYVVYLRDTKGFKASTIHRKVSAIRKAHKANAHQVDTSSLSELLKGLRREAADLSEAKQAAALRMSDLVEVCEQLSEQGTARAIRDKAVLLVGFIGGFRRSELASLRWEDLKEDEKGFTVLVRKSKTDQEGQGMVKAIPFRSNYKACPVRALRALKAWNLSGPIFPSITKGDRIQPEGMSAKAIDRIVKRYFGKGYSAHSLRSGFVTEAATKGASHQQIMNQTGHKDVKTVQRYTRFSDVWEANAASLV